jgi:hypothetical protein
MSTRMERLSKLERGRKLHPTKVRETVIAERNKEISALKKKLTASQAMLHSMMQLYVCTRGTGKTVKEAMDRAKDADKVLVGVLKEYGLNAKDIKRGFQRFYWTQERHNAALQPSREDK